MSDLYKFDINIQPITMYEWDDGGWEREFLRSSETLSANLDGTITLTKARGQLLKQTVYSPMANHPTLFVETSETYLANTSTTTSITHTHHEEDLEHHQEVELDDQSIEHHPLIDNTDLTPGTPIISMTSSTTSVVASTTAPMPTSGVRAKYWKDHRDLDHVDLQTSESHSLVENATDAAAQAVTLSDALRILKMVVGQETTAGQALTPYQVLAADFDGDGGVDLSDALGVIKHLVGSGTQAPVWRFVKAASAELDDIVAHPHQYSALPAVVIDTSVTTDPTLELVGFLAGDVDASYA